MPRPPTPRQIPTARAAAVESLLRWQASHLPIDHLLQEQCSDLAPRDRNLTMELTYGVLRQRDHLDRTLDLLSSHPRAKMKPLLLMVLRVGLYQLLFCDRIPARAAVAETVEVLRHHRQPRWLTGFANGVLRGASRSLGSLPDPDSPDQAGRPVFNHPLWLSQRWESRYGQRLTETICRINNLPPRATLCVNSQCTNRSQMLDLLAAAGIEAVKGEYAPLAILLDRDSGPIFDLPGYADGRFFIQDQAAQLATLLLSPLKPAARYLDACAGLGGKTSQLAMALPTTTHLLAIEPTANRFQRLGQNLHRLGLADRVQCRCSTLQDLAQTKPEPFDGILVDAPCSGTGVIRRQPDIRWNRTAEDLQRNQHLQLELLHQAARLLHPGGILVYATCSLEPEENQEVISRFLTANPRFRLSPADDHLPASAHSLIDEQGCLAPLPGETIDGFFGARLELDTAS